MATPLCPVEPGGQMFSVLQQHLATKVSMYPEPVLGLPSRLGLCGLSFRWWVFQSTALFWGAEAYNIPAFLWSLLLFLDCYLCPKKDFLPCHVLTTLCKEWPRWVLVYLHQHPHKLGYGEGAMLLTEFKKWWALHSPGLYFEFQSVRSRGVFLVKRTCIFRRSAIIADIFLLRSHNNTML